MSTDAPMDVDPPTPSPLARRPEPDPERASSSATTSGSSTAERAAGTSGGSRLERVSAKDLCDFKSGLELVWVMYGAIQAHQRLYEDAGILHGDINVNTIVMLETEDGKAEGAFHRLRHAAVQGCDAEARKSGPGGSPACAPAGTLLTWLLPAGAVNLMDGLRSHLAIKFLGFLGRRYVSRLAGL